MVQLHRRRYIYKSGEPVLLTETQLKAILKKWDANKDGVLDNNELAQVFRYLGAYYPTWRASRALSVADHDSDGFISQKELDTLVYYASQKGYEIN